MHQRDQCKWDEGTLVQVPHKPPQCGWGTMELFCILQGVEALHVKKYESDWSEVGWIWHLLVYEGTGGPVACCAESLTLSLLCFWTCDAEGDLGPVLRLDWTSHLTQIHWTASFFLYVLTPSTEAHVWYNLTQSLMYDMIWFEALVWYDLQTSPVYDINLWATTTMVLRIRGVKIPINLVSSTTDSSRKRVVLSKLVLSPTSDPKSEFLCQSSCYCAEPTDSPEPPLTPGISPTPRTPCFTHTAIALVLWQSI